VLLTLRFLGGRVKQHYAVMMKYLLPVVKKRRATKDTNQVRITLFVDRLWRRGHREVV
jgi:hypothetical protein